MADPVRFGRVFDILEYLAANPSGRTMAQIRKDLGLPSSSTHDLLRVMALNEAIILGPDRSYSLGPRSVRLGLLVGDSIGVRTVSRPYMIDLVERIREDVYLAAQVGHVVVYADRYVGPEPVSISIRLGVPRPLHCTAAGKLFAAFNPELRRLALQADSLRSFTGTTITDPSRLQAEFETIRVTQLSVSQEESVQGIVGLAAPVFGPDRSVIAAVHVSALRSRTPSERIPGLLAEAKQTAERITRALGGRWPTEDLDGRQPGATLTAGSPAIVKGA